MKVARVAHNAMYKRGYRLIKRQKSFVQSRLCIVSINVANTSVLALRHGRCRI
ncbi:hypothetical protein BSU04_29340 [Caballeronia sordidicola]|uniref:Uncharacterized protein n=1 Tax=Caballeronia sordidicola TaxID=196367 RepID=A0A226WWF4_CABSO|nr:hypothetical protein BSU04_29340 [Caballeronia sordidicola]